MTRSGYFRPVSGGISGLCVEPDDNPLSDNPWMVNFTSVEKLRALRIAWLHRKVMVEDFLTQYAVFNGSEIYCTVNCRSVEKLRTLHIAWLHRKVMVEDFRTQYAFFNGPAIDCTGPDPRFAQNIITRCAWAQGRVKRFSLSVCVSSKHGSLPLEIRHVIALYRSVLQLRLQTAEFNIPVTSRLDALKCIVFNGRKDGCSVYKLSKC